MYAEANYTIQNSGMFMLNCVCKLSASFGEINATIKWYDRRSGEIQSVNSSVLTFEMEDNVEGIV